MATPHEPEGERDIGRTHASGGGNSCGSSEGELVDIVFDESSTPGREEGGAIACDPRCERRDVRSGRKAGGYRGSHGFGGGDGGTSEGDEGAATPSSSIVTDHKASGVNGKSGRSSSRTSTSGPPDDVSGAQYLVKIVTSHGMRLL